jgi:hypothetical protein
VAIEDAKQIFGAGQARNRAARAVEFTAPLQFACQTLATTWYATTGHDPADIDAHRARAPWHARKTQLSTADMLGKLRRVLIAAGRVAGAGRAAWAERDQPEQGRQAPEVTHPGLLGASQIEQGQEVTGVQPRLWPDRNMLGQDRQLESAVARTGILEVDKPDPAGVPQEIGQVRVPVTQHGLVI